jgi:hypothetical protein
MTSESRTEKSVKNAKIALVFYFINLILQFFSRKIFLDYLGAEVLGLNTTAQNLLGFLNLAELGVGSAIAYTLYRPLFEKDIQAINEIVSVQGWMYRKIACIVIVGACVLMCFFPMIFQKADVPLWYAYGSFAVLLTSSLLGYFFNYRQIVLTADQKEYKITQSVQGLKVIKVIVQILAIRYLSHGYVYWLGLELLAAILTTIVLDRLIKSAYPWLHSLPSVGKKVRKKYQVIIIKTKQVFFHQISFFVLSQTSPLVIYAYTSLTLVAIYGNYMLIMTGITSLINALLNGVRAGVGNLVAEGDKKRIKAVFWELTSCRVWFASMVCFGLYLLSHSFIRLWIGEEYILEQSAFVALVVITFIGLTRANDAFLSAYGLFQDIWAPMIEAALNLGCSILFGYYYGLAGILWGVVVSLIIVIVGWKPYFLYKRGFEDNIMEYVLYQFKCFGLIGVAVLVSYVVLACVYRGYQITTYGRWIGYALGVVIIYGVFSFLLFYVFDRGMRDFVSRIKRMFVN